MRDYFKEQAKDPEYRRLKEELEPGYQFARAIGELQDRLGVSFEEFCQIIGVDEEKLKSTLMEFQVPPADMLQKILKATQSRITFNSVSP